jgi:hypothetical protein
MNLAPVGLRRVLFIFKKLLIFLGRKSRLLRWACSVIVYKNFLQEKKQFLLRCKNKTGMIFVT